MTKLAFSSDDRQLISASLSGKVQAWDWTTGDAIAEVCSRVGRNLTPAEWQQFLGSEPYRVTCPGLPAS